MPAEPLLMPLLTYKIAKCREHISPKRKNAAGRTVFLSACAPREGKECSRRAEEKAERGLPCLKKPKAPKCLKKKTACRLGTSRKNTEPKKEPRFWPLKKEITALLGADLEWSSPKKWTKDPVGATGWSVKYTNWSAGITWRKGGEKILSFLSCHALFKKATNVYCLRFANYWFKIICGFRW